MEYKPTIGLEIHVELKTKTKMFCGCLNNPDEPQPNKNICPICTGHPGTLPTINKEAVEKVLKLGTALSGKLAENGSKFDRKNYFYPDLPKGYQISQYDQPLVSGGNLNGVKLTRIHLEEDVARLIHSDQLSDYPKDKSRASLIDFNRSGIPLMELVTEPDIKSGKEAVDFAKELQLTLRYLDISDADMEKGHMRIEVNVSIRPNGDRIKTNDKRIILKDESYRLMGLLFEIHNKLGSIYKEKNYQDAIEEILKRENIYYEREKEIKMKFENLEIGNFFADFIIDNKIILEIKATKFITQEDIKQVLRCIKNLNLPLGIIVNFHGSELEYKRIINPKFDNNLESFGENSGEVPLGTKVEVKNINSFKAVEGAVDYEIKRQAEVLEKGEKVKQETRGWDDKKKTTVSQRIKEEAHDYRYFPEPDLPPMDFSSADSGFSAKGGSALDWDLEKLKSEIPELPQQKRERFAKEYGFSKDQIEILISDPEFAEYFEESASELKTFGRNGGIDIDNQLLYNYLTSDLRGLMKGKNLDIKNLKIIPEHFAHLVFLISSGKLTSRMAKDILAEMLTGADPETIIKEKAFHETVGEETLNETIDAILKENQKAIEDYKKGQENSLQFLIGQAMKKLKGRADPEILKKLIKNKL